MMKNMSIRTRILLGVVLVNLIGAIAVVVYLHGAYGGNLDEQVAKGAVSSQGAWEQLAGEAGVDPMAQPEQVQRILDSMKAITGADYGFLVDKEVVAEEAFGAAREKLGLPSSWEEGDVYAPLYATDDNAAAKMVFEAPVGDVAETARVVGVENGECSEACHNGLTEDSAYWMIKWSTDGASRGHAVFPVYSGDNAVGVVYMLEDVTVAATNARKTVTQTLLVVLATLVVATVMIGALIDLLILRRLRNMTESIEEISLRLAGGDFDAEYEADGTTDEIGSFEEFFSDFIKLVSTTLKSLANR